MTATAEALVMIVDDDERIRGLVRTALATQGHDVIEAASAEEALLRLDDSLPDVVITDLVMPGASGIKFVEEARRRDPSLALIMMSGFGTIESTVEAMRCGACDFVTKPFTIDRLNTAVQAALESQALRRDVYRLHNEQCKKLGEIGSVLIGSSPKMTSVFRMIKQVAKSPTTTVLIQGESGTGKELIAKAIHQYSERRDNRFVDINCAALTETLLEAELFGYEKGAFTGAVTNGKSGLFEAANGGTVFLDEIGEMSLSLQAKLLRVLQEKRFKRVGGIEDIEVDVRIIASTNRDMETMVQEGNFRLDLYYRLRVVPILVPALRERPEDIQPIAMHYVEMFSRQLRRKIAGMTAEARTALEMHPWPGNVRELRNVMERAVILSSTDKIGTDALLFGGISPVKQGGAFDFGDGSLAEMEKRLIRKVLDSTSWKRAEAARILGINRTTLYNKIREYALAQGQG